MILYIKGFAGRIMFLFLVVVITIVSLFSSILQSKVLAAAGINRQINFQGKVVNKTSGTNVTDGNYNFTFKVYDAPSAGTVLWTENYNTTNGNQLAVASG